MFDTTIYNGFYSDLERQFACMEVEQDAISCKLDAMYNIVEATRQANIDMIEANVMMESGTCSQLTQLIMEADEEASAQKASIFKKTAGMIDSMIDKLKVTVSSVMSKMNPDEKINVPKKMPEAINKIKSAWGKVSDFAKKVASNAVSSLKEVPLKDILALLAGVAALIGTSIEYKNMQKNQSHTAVDDINKAYTTITRKQAATWIRELNDSCLTPCKKAVAGIAKSDFGKKLAASSSSIIRDGLKAFQEIIKQIRSITLTLMKSPVSKAIGKKTADANINESTDVDDLFELDSFLNF